MIGIDDDQTGIATLRRQFLDFVGVKSEEAKEQRSARHYYHADQWTADEIAVLNRRKQPVVTFNRYARKINGVVGLLERLKQDPKAYPRTPQQAQGAELGTATLRYALDVALWEAKSPEAALKSANEGQGGIALTLVSGDHGDPELDIEPVDNDLFFYDQRSFRSDYSDARYMGIVKWVDEDVAKEMFPEQAEAIGELIANDGDFDTEATQDRSFAWANTGRRQVRIVEHWYLKGGQWNWCFYSGDKELGRGVSPFYDEKGRTICRFIMFAAAIDHDGDRYGFFRNLKSAQDEINHRRSKGLFETMGRRIIAMKGTLKDVEETRREAVRADGVIEWDDQGRGDLGKPEFDDRKSDAAFRSQVELLQEAKDEIENFGPNQALIGQGLDTQSGRAIALLQQAGLAELGPFILAHRNWKIRVYRAVWNAIQRYWKAERWIRVTDDEGVAQFIQINGVGLDDAGQPSMVNALGALDVDVILDEGPDTINMQADAFESLKMMPPQFVAQFPEAFIELAPLPESTKKQMRDKARAAQQPNPLAQRAQEAEIAVNEAKAEETRTKALKNLADAHEAGQPEPQAMPAMQPERKPPSESINFKDVPPDAQSQMLAQAGIYISPDALAFHAAQENARKAAEKQAAQAARQPAVAS